MTESSSIIPEVDRGMSIPMSSPDITDQERGAVQAVLNTPNLSMGEQISAFEERFTRLTGRKHAVAVSSGTAGLHLCIRAIGVQENDLVVTTPFSFVASSNVVLFERGIPVFVDVDAQTGNINPQQLQEAVADLAAGGKAAKRWLPRLGAERAGSLKAILTVDVFGQPADADPILATAADFDLPVIEDSCEALGAEYKGRPAGTLGDFGMFAFYPNKQITTGEGGVLVTDDDQAAGLIRALRNQGRAPGDTWLQHTHLGYNYRLNELNAALGNVQMDRLEILLAKRQAVAEEYARCLAELSAVEVPVIEPYVTRQSWFVYVIRLGAGVDRDRVAHGLAEFGVPARPYFLPIHLQPYMVERFGYQEGDFPVTEDLGRRGLALPFSSVMETAQVHYVCEALRRVLTGMGR